MQQKREPTCAAADIRDMQYVSARGGGRPGSLARLRRTRHTVLGGGSARIRRGDRRGDHVVRSAQCQQNLVALALVPVGGTAVNAFAFAFWLLRRARGSQYGPACRAHEAYDREAPQTSSVETQVFNIQQRDFCRMFARMMMRRRPATVARVRRRHDNKYQSARHGLRQAPAWHTCASSNRSAPF